MRSVEVGSPISVEDVLDIGHGRAHARLGEGARVGVAAARGVVEASLADGQAHYGINTGFGALAEVRIEPTALRRLQLNLVRSHAAGVGAPLPRAVVRMLLLLRAQVLAAGHSGVRADVIEMLLAMLERRVHPRVPEQGSVGASGDLAPLAHLALVLVGEGQAEIGPGGDPDATTDGAYLDGGAALARVGLQPIELAAKEGLALINGTQVMMAIALHALERSERALRAADIAAALSIEGFLGSTRPADPRIHDLRPYDGQRAVAANFRALCAGSPLIASHKDCNRVQDPYSFRCAPQVHGAARDAIAHVRRVLAVEIASVTDNPLVFPGADDGDVPEGAVISGGNFHGQPVSLVCDFARIALTSLASICERRVEQLVNPHLSNGLPAFLARDPGLESGLMIAQVTATALVSECKGLSMPASVDSIPSSASREDHVSMGPIAARRWLDVVGNLERVVGIELLAAAQAVDLRAPLRPGLGTSAAHAAIREVVAGLHEDRVLHGDIEAAAELVRSGALEASVRAAVPELA
ncbi:MAG: histidine ammonia-lyase [Deltaproteobacteria bacterium]|nr:histidine ammonia-lyase [Deltaproteobacteria bacterium]